MAMRCGIYRHVAIQFLIGGSGQICDKKEMIAAAAIARERKEREILLEEDYKITLEKAQEYEKLQQRMEDTFYAMQKYVEELGFPTPFLKKSDALSQWMDLNGVSDDVQTIWDQHYENFADIYSFYASQGVLEEDLIQAKRVKENILPADAMQDKFIQDVSVD